MWKDDGVKCEWGRRRLVVGKLLHIVVGDANSVVSKVLTDGGQPIIDSFE